MSSRFHNKFHRHNHHTVSTGDPRYPDASYDPIASPDSPFQGDFILNGSLSASSPVIGIINFQDDTTFQQDLSAKQTTGEFVKVLVNGQERLLRLWEYVP